MKSDLPVAKHNPVSVFILSRTENEWWGETKQKGIFFFTKRHLCSHKSGLGILSFDSATYQSFFDFFTHKTGWRTGKVWYILPLLQSILLTPQPGRQPICQILWWQYSGGSTALRSCLRALTRHCLALLHWRGQILKNSAIASATHTCPQNFNGVLTHCNAMLNCRKDFWLWNLS